MLNNQNLDEVKNSDLRERILDNAFTIIKQQGLTHTSISKIAMATHMSKTTFYKLFKSKEEMIYELCRLQAERSLRDFNSKLNGRKQMTMAEGKEFLHFIVVRDDTIYRFMKTKDWESLRGKLTPEQMEEINPPSRKQNTNNIKQILSRIQGIRTDVDIESVSSLIGFLIFSYKHWKQEKPDVSWELLSDAAYQCLFQLMFEDGE